MKIGIIGAMDEEIEYIQKIMKNKIKINIANVSYIEGEIENKDVVLLKSGIGKVNAAMATTILMERFEPSYVINTGSAGGFSSDLEVGDIVIANEVVHHDVDVTAFDYTYGQVPNMPSTYKADESLIKKAKTALDTLHIRNKIGLLGTADSFMSDDATISSVKNKFPTMIAAEMEGAAIAQVCYQYEIPFIIIRSISDIAGKESPISFNKFLQLAAKNATKIIQHFISQ